MLRSWRLLLNYFYGFQIPFNESALNLWKLVTVIVVDLILSRVVYVQSYWVALVRPLGSIGFSQLFLELSHFFLQGLDHLNRLRVVYYLPIRSEDVAASVWWSWLPFLYDFCTGHRHDRLGPIGEFESWNALLHAGWRTAYRCNHCGFAVRAGKGILQEAREFGIAVWYVVALLTESEALNYLAKGR